MFILTLPNLNKVMFFSFENGELKEEISVCVQDSDKEMMIKKV